MAKVLLISYDNDSHIPFFPINLFYLAGTLKKANHTVGIWLQDIHHGREEALTQILDENPFDVVGLGFVAGYYQYAKAKKISEAVNNSKRRKEFNYVLGGHGPAAEWEYFIRVMGADTVVIGDGEKAICDIASSNVKGCVQGDPTEDSESPIGLLEELFPVQVYRLIRLPTSARTSFNWPILSSRGCLWKCSFCFRMRSGFYARSTESIIHEIKYLHTHFGINHFQFADELLMSSKERTAEICNAILKLNFKMKWDCNGRLNFLDRKISSLMKESGCEYVNLGIESLDQKILNQMGKGLSVNQIYQGVEAALREGLSLGLNFIWGFPGDTEENLLEAVKFLTAYDPCDELRTIRPVTPYPGCRLYKLATEKGLLEGPEDFYERKHKNSDLFTVNFTEYPLKVAHEMLYTANSHLLMNYYRKRQAETLMQAHKLYRDGDASFRGFRTV